METTHLKIKAEPSNDPALLEAMKAPCPLCWRHVLPMELTQCDLCQIECCRFCSMDNDQPDYCRCCFESRKLKNPKVRFLYVNPAIIATHAINWQKAYNFAKAMERGDRFPPVKAAYNEHGQIIVRNGAHRTHAARLTGMALLIRIKQRKKPLTIDTETFPPPGKPSSIYFPGGTLSGKTAMAEKIIKDFKEKYPQIEIFRIGSGMERSSCAAPNYCCGKPKKEDKT